MTTTYPRAVVLKAGKERSLMQRHPWIFSGAVDSLPQITPGEMLPVLSSTGAFLAHAYFNPTNSLAGRVLTFKDEPVDRALERLLQEAYALRRAHMQLGEAAAYRLVNAEGDGLPGLVVDCYGELVVVQINTCGMERLKPLIVQILKEVINPKSIYEKSTSAARRLEGLEDSEGLLYGTPMDEVVIEERGVRFITSASTGQKTGFFLDQREMRTLVMQHAKGRKVLNCFSYTGGFALFALKGGAEYVESVDSSAEALQFAARNTELNGFAAHKHKLIQEDAFNYLKRSAFDFDFVILDPPAFAKKRSDVDAACRGYKEINRQALEKMPAGSLLLTASCSHHISDELFQNLLFQASAEAGRNVKILSRHHQALDHPISIYHPEGSYLKSLLLYLH
ncbi:MAG: class I SAM-dependent rRNA methyltransferase [Chlamydiales bacterium]|nr:class I SAM-dependent rRNA methyltransferase [Chlamydiales bacterium]